MAYKIGMNLIKLGLWMVAGKNKEIYPQGFLSVDRLTIRGLLDTLKRKMIIGGLRGTRDRDGTKAGHVPQHEGDNRDTPL